MDQGSNETSIFLNAPCSVVIKLQEGRDAWSKNEP
ncbi:hypothetical protein BDE27_0441 [Xenorhabdus ehlersii]|uniref:Uncharacterized protein n=1 Tax=Xenorhabdus ehlersii TaxID=290111 RepID=A0A2D0IP37_9GAMM|nr:hypothetical protein [Xenorhabdus sp. TS4]PHM23616.1 hypothetical protein Xehl_02616 [Xenorhabdus ehlersii]RKE92780.1 hypothetical protein BDE27_0441 [Xenorhabdus ehlersii]